MIGVASFGLSFIRLLLERKIFVKSRNLRELLWSNKLPIKKRKKSKQQSLLLAISILQDRMLSLESEGEH